MLRRVDAHRLAQRPRERLERRLDHVVRVTACFDAQVQRQLGRVGKRTEELLCQLVLETARETVDRVMALWPTLQKELPLDQEARHQITAHMKSVPLLAR